MAEKRRFQIVVLLLTSVVGTVAWISPAKAQFAEAKDNTNDSNLQSVLLEWSQQNNPDFSQDGRPKDTAGGASRSGCLVKDSLHLTALVPQTSVAKTLAATPTFWFYVPHALTSEQAIEFVLKNERDEYIYKTKSVAEISPGIVSISLPPTVNLKVDRDYDWYFLIHCAPQHNKRFAYVNGTIRRVELPHLPNLKTATAKERLVIYATEKLWYDALTNLARRAIANPEAKAVLNDWHTLLKSVELEELATKPFVPCCSATE